MKKSYLIALAGVLVLAGCQCFQKADVTLDVDGFDPRLVRRPNPLLPNVFVTKNGRIVVDQEPISIDSSHPQGGRVTIYWSLERGEPNTFPKTDGIVLKPGSNKDQDKPVRPECKPHGNPEKAKVYQCSFDAVRGHSKYKYTVKVLREGKILELDPYVETDI